MHDFARELEALADTLSVPAAEYVPAIGDALTMIDRMRCALLAEARAPAAIPEGKMGQAVASCASGVVVPAGSTIERGFEYDNSMRQHIPTVLVKFPPVCIDNKLDADHAWTARDRLAAALVASDRDSLIPSPIEAQAGEPKP